MRSPEKQEVIMTFPDDPTLSLVLRAPLHCSGSLLRDTGLLWYMTIQTGQCVCVSQLTLYKVLNFPIQLVSLSVEIGFTLQITP